MTTLLLLLLGTADATDIQCTAKGGTGLVYEQWQKAGGARPGPDTPTHRETWKVGETVLHQIERTNDGTVSVSGRLDWEWDTEATEMGKTTGSQWMRTTPYTTRVTLWHRDEQPIHGTISEGRIEFKMKCTATEKFGVP